MQHRAVAVVSFALALCFACTEHRARTPPGTTGDGSPASQPDGGGPPTGSGTLRIEPLDREETIDGAPVVVDYRAFLRSADGTEREVTTETAFVSTVPALGTFSGARFTSGLDGGRTTVRASLGGAVATTTLTLRSDRVFVTPGTPADAPTRFGGAEDAAYAPELVYPEDQTMVPPNLGELEIHFRPNGGTVFELHVVTPLANLRIYFGCSEAVSGGCIYTPERDVWDAISSAARGQGPITYTLRGADDAGHLGAAASRSLTVAEEDITGGLYYWNAGGGTIDRFEFGVRGAVAENFLDQGRAGALICVGCHALSRDGRRIAIGTDQPTTTLQVFDIASRNRLWMSGGGGGFGLPNQPNFHGFSTDGSQLASSSLDGIVIRNGDTGAMLAGPLGGGPGTMPDYSPDGQHIAFVRHDSAPPFGGGLIADVLGVVGGRIQRLDWNGSAWVQGPELVSGGGNNYYPAYAPDGQWVVFNRSPGNMPSVASAEDGSTMTAYVADAELWFIRADGTGAAVELERADGLGDSWPKFDPTQYMDNGRPIFWLAWSSHRAFGLRYGDATRVQLWMAAFDPELAATGGDPGLAAFRLPFQDIESGNHIAQWVTSVQRMTCDTNVDCGGEFCVDGRCYEEEPLF
jgi:hypothetical protein